nr:serine protease inhibitor [Arthrobacter sp. HY1533]
MTGPAATGPIDLTITVTATPGAAPANYRLVASGATPDAASTVPDPAAALAALEQSGEKIFFPASAPPQNCTQQYGGPEVATVTGTFKGRDVNAAFSRTDGCQISRWQALAPLFGGTAGSTGAM